MLYFFILGRNPTLSIAEIANLLKSRICTNSGANNTNIREICGRSVKIRELPPEVLILETKDKIDCQSLQRRLGGTIKIGEIISQINTNLDANDTNIIREICGSLEKICDSKKVHFGFSFYRLDGSVNLRQFLPQIKRLALKIKQELKKNNISSRWVTGREYALSSVIVQKNKLLTQGAEFVLLIDREKIYLGRTLSVQEFEEYSQRDYGRPVRQISQGLIPPKLAKIMINLAQVPLDSHGRIRIMSAEGRLCARPEAEFACTILDPFCGSGTILQEAVLMGYRNVVGADLSEEAVRGAQKNLEWFFKNPKSQFLNSKQIAYSAEAASATKAGQNSKIQIFQCDVKNLSKVIAPNSIDAVVTEPYLGPTKVSSYKLQVSSLVSELSGLYLAAFREFKQVLKKNGRVVIILPIFSQKIEHPPNPAEAGEGGLPIILSEIILPRLKKIGWRIQPIIPEEFRKYPFIQITSRQSIIYSRPDQIVLREIFIFINPAKS